MSGFLGLDLSLTATGVYLYQLESEDVCFEIKTGPHMFKHDIMRVNHISDEIINFVKKTNPEFIVLEDYFTGRQPRTVIQLATLGTIVRYKLLINNFPFFTVAPTQVKKFATSNGACPKDVVIKCVFKKWNCDVDSNNIADACAIAHVSKVLYHEINNIPQEILVYEQDVIKKLLKEKEKRYFDSI